MARGDTKRLEVMPGTEAEADFVLKRATVNRMALENSPDDALLWAFRLRNRRFSHGWIVACGL